MTNDPDAPSERPYYVGVADEVLNPPLDLNVSLGGFLRRKYATGALDDLHARAIFLTNHHDPPHLLVQCDLLGIPAKSTYLVRRQIAKRTGVPTRAITINGSHTHGGPDPTGIFSVKVVRSAPRAFPNRDVLQHLHRQIIAAGVRATDPARLHGPVHVGVAHLDPAEAYGHRRRAPYGPISRPITVLAFATRRDARHVPRAVLVNYAGHPTWVGGTKYSADYPGYVVSAFQALLREHGAGTEPAGAGDAGGAETPVVAYLNGACGDVSVNYGRAHPELRDAIREHYPQLDPDSPTYQPGVAKMWSRQERKAYRAETRRIGVAIFGEKLAREAFHAYQKIQFRPMTRVRVRRKFILIPLGLIPFPRLKWNHRHRRYSLSKLWNWVSFKLKILLVEGLYRLVNRGLSPHFIKLVRKNRRVFVQSEVQAARLDAAGHPHPIYLLYSPSEPFTDLAGEVRAMVPSPDTLFAELCNDFGGYVFRYKEFLYGGYENLFAYSPLSGEYLVSTFRQVLADLQED